MKKLLAIILLSAVTAFALPSTNKTSSVSVAWDPYSYIHPEAGKEAGFILYYGTASGSYTWSTNVGFRTNFTFTGLLFNTTYYSAVTSYDTNGVESDFSNEINWNHKKPQPPTYKFSGVLQASISVQGGIWEDVTQLVEYVAEADETKFYRVKMKVE